MTPEALTELIVGEARRLGFCRVGVAPVDAEVRYRAYRRWLAAGRGGSMTYLIKPHQLAARRDPRVLLARARTVVVVALAYAKRGGEGPGDDRPRGFVARYARGEDYHQVIRDKLGTLAAAVSEALGRDVAARPCVDSAPVLERDLAEVAGLGFVAKNTMLIAPGVGSYLVLGELLLDADAAPTPRFDEAATRCGSCTACLDACPTGAFPEPHVLDARRCISYLTIEHRGPIPRELRAAVDTMVFGCDICQEVCPYNAAAPDRTPPAPELAPLADDRGALDLVWLLERGTNQMRRLIEGTALRRAPRNQLRRNAAVALGNAGDPRAVPALTAALSDRDPIVRGHAAWALGRLDARAALEAALAAETDAYVRDELTAALAASERGG